jgi:hypothetical protein
MLWMSIAALLSFMVIHFSLASLFPFVKVGEAIGGAPR